MADATTVARRTPRHTKREEPRCYSITDLAQAFDGTPRAIRFYEDVGLLEGASSARRRLLARA